MRPLPPAHTTSLVSLVPSRKAQMDHLSVLHQQRDWQSSKEVPTKLRLLVLMCSSSSLLRNCRQKPRETNSNPACSSRHISQPSNKQVASNSSRQRLLQGAKRTAQTCWHP